MPMYLAKKRDAPPPTKGMQVDSTYERGTASGLRYFAFGRPNFGYHVMMYFMATITRLLCFCIDHATTTASLKKNITTTWIPMKKREMIPIVNPDGALAFPHGHRTNPVQSSFLAKYDASVPTPVYRGKKQFQFNILSRLQDEDIPDFMAFETSTKPITAPSDSLSPIGYKAYLDILNIVSAVAILLRYGTTIDDNETVSNFTIVEAEISTDVDEISSTILSSSGPLELSIEEIKSKDGSKHLKWSDETALVVQGEDMKGQAWGLPSNFERTVGLAVPYRRDYSTPDTGIINHFLSRFFPICDKSTLDDDIAGMDEYLAWLVDWWKKEICNTTQGEWIAHMMKVMMMCTEVGCGLYVCVSNGMYLGSMMAGKGWSIQIGREVYRGTDILDDELGALDSHSASLDKILDIIRVPKPRQSPTSMRALRELVVAQPLTPSDKMKISELLVSLDFGSLPDSVNATTVKNTVNLLCDPTVPIKADMYLYHSEFWTEDRNRLILGRFGARAPTFMTGSKKYRLAPNAHGQGINGAEPFSTKPPAVFQMAIVPIQKAASDWDYILKTGMANMEGVVEITGSKVVFKGQGAKDVWTTCTGYIHMAINRTLGQGATDSSMKRGEDVLEEGEVEDIPRAPKKQKFNPFS